jgi:hypothetical protein
MWQRPKVVHLLCHEVWKHQSPIYAQPRDALKIQDQWYISLLKTRAFIGRELKKFVFLYHDGNTRIFSRVAWIAREIKKNESLPFLLFSIYEIEISFNKGNRKYFPWFYRAIETRVEVWKKREIPWEHEHEVRASVSTQFRDIKDVAFSVRCASNIFKCKIISLP